MKRNAGLRKRNKRVGETNRDPLKKIVDYVYLPLMKDRPDVTFRHEKLECGHAVLPRHDAIGETNASSRRCRACRKEAEAAEAQKPESE